jgi:hypothetical protein
LGTLAVNIGTAEGTHEEHCESEIWVYPCHLAVHILASNNTGLEMKSSSSSDITPCKSIDVSEENVAYIFGV